MSGRRGRQAQAVEEAWTAEHPHNAVELCRSIFNAFGKSVNKESKGYMELIDKLINFLKEHENKLSKQEADSLLKEWKANHKDLHLIHRKSASIRKKQDQVAEHIEALGVDEEVSIEDALAHAEALLEEDRSRLNEIEKYETGKKIICWRKKDERGACGRIMGKNGRSEYYVLCDDGSVETLPYELREILMHAHWKDYHSMKKDTQYPALVRTMIDEKYPEFSDKTLYKVSQETWSTRPIDDDELHVPWACVPKPEVFGDDSAKTWKALTAWKRKAASWKKYFDEDTDSVVHIGGSEHKIHQLHNAYLVYLQSEHDDNVVCLQSKEPNEFLGFFGGMWRKKAKKTAEKQHKIEIRIKNSSEREFLYYDKNFNVISMIAQTETEDEANVELRLQKTKGIRNGRFFIAVATKKIEAGDKLFFKANFGIVHEVSEKKKKKKAATEPDDSSSADEAHHNSSSSSSEEERPPAAEVATTRSGRGTKPPARLIAEDAGVKQKKAKK
jgi:hypothetical protein